MSLFFLRLTGARLREIFSDLCVLVDMLTTNFNTRKNNILSNYGQWVFLLYRLIFSVFYSNEMNLDLQT